MKWISSRIYILCFMFCSIHAYTGLVAAEPLLQAITTISKLKFVNSVSLANKTYPTYHPQGVKIIGRDLYLSTVQGRSKGFGHLIHYQLDVPFTPTLANPVARMTFDPGADKKMIHPGGIDIDGGTLLVPLANYTARGPGQLLRVDLNNFGTYKVVTKLNDHIGTVVADDMGFRMMNWDAKKIYSLDRLSGMSKTTLKGSGWNYQDCKRVAAEYALCSALKGKIIRDGEIHLITFSPDEDNKVQVVHRIKVENFNGDGSPGGSRPLTNNAMDFAPVYAQGSGQITGVRFYFVPHDDDNTHLMIYDGE